MENRKIKIPQELFDSTLIWLEKLQLSNLKNKNNIC